MDTPFTVAQAQQFPVPAFKIAYTSPDTYSIDTVVLSQLQTLKIYVAYTPLSSTAPGAGPDYSSWFVTKVEGEYQPSYTGSLAVLTATHPIQTDVPLLLAVEVHDAAEPEGLVLPDFEGPVQMLYGYACVPQGLHTFHIVSPHVCMDSDATTAGGAPLCMPLSVSYVCVVCLWFCEKPGSSLVASASFRPFSISRGSSARCTRTRFRTTVGRLCFIDPRGPSEAGED